MGGLLKHDNDNQVKSPDKKVNVNVSSISRKQAGFGEDSAEKIPTFDVNMRVDNHTRNAVLALSKASADKRSASEMVSLMIESYLESLTPQTRDTYDELVSMMETKDKLDYKLKSK